MERISARVTALSMSKWALRQPRSNVLQKTMPGNSTTNETDKVTLKTVMKHSPQQGERSEKATTGTTRKKKSKVEL